MLPNNSKLPKRNESRYQLYLAVWRSLEIVNLQKPLKISEDFINTIELKNIIFRDETVKMVVKLLIFTIAENEHSEI